MYKVKEIMVIAGSGPRALRILTVCAAATFAGAAAAAVYDDAGTAAPFLSIGTGARAAAMGEAFVAVADDASAVYWNPAGLAQISKFEAQFSHNEWVSGFRQEYFGAAIPLAGTLSIAWSVIDLGEFDELSSSGSFTGNYFSVNDQVYTVGYGRGVMKDTLLVGAAAKLVREDMGDGFVDRVAVIDLGAIAVPWYSLPGLSMAVAVQNIPTGGDLSGFQIPVTLRAGAAWRKQGVLLAPAPTAPGVDMADPEIQRQLEGPWGFDRASGDEILLAADIVIPRHGRLEFRAGAEYWWLSVAALRIGYRLRYPRNELGNLSGLTLGGGLRGHGFQVDYGFDYSYAPYGDLGSASRFSLLIAF